MHYPSRQDGHTSAWSGQVGSGLGNADDGSTRWVCGLGRLALHLRLAQMTAARLNGGATPTAFVFRHRLRSGIQAFRPSGSPWARSGAASRLHPGVDMTRGENVGHVLPGPVSSGPATVGHRDFAPWVLRPAEQRPLGGVEQARRLPARKDTGPTRHTARFSPPWVIPDLLSLGGPTGR